MKIDRFLQGVTKSSRGRTPPSPGERVMTRMFPNQGIGSYANWGYQDRAKSVSHFVSWAYAAININASLVGQHTPNLAWVSNDEDSGGDVRRDVRKWYGMGMGLSTGATKDGDVYSPGGIGANLGLHLAGGQRTGHNLLPGFSRYKAYSTVKPHEELEPLPADHALRRLIATPNPYDTTYALLYELIMFLKLTGIAYLWCVPDGWGVPCELWVMPSHWVWPRTGTGAYADPKNARLISYYEVRPYGSGISGSGMLRIPKEEVISFRYPSPLSQIDGWSKLTAVSMWLDTQESMDKSAWSQMQNQGLPSSFIELPADNNDPSQELIDRLEAKFLEKLGGEYNVGKPLFGSPGMKITPLSFSPESMMYPTMGDSYRDRILAAFGIPKSALGISEGMTYGSILATLAQTCSFVINPDFTMLGQQLTKDLCPRFLNLGYRAKALGGWETGFARLDTGKRRILTDLEAGRVLRLNPNGTVKRFKVRDEDGELDTAIRAWWDDCTPPDPSQVNSDIAQDMACLAISPDEVRAIRGRAPWGDPQAGNPWVNGPNGWVPIPLAVQDKEGMQRLADLMEPLKKMGEEQGTHERNDEDKPSVEGMGDDGQPQPVTSNAAEGEPPALENDLPEVGMDPTVEHPNGKPHKSSGRNRVAKAACKPGETAASTGCTPLGESDNGGGAHPEGPLITPPKDLKARSEKLTKETSKHLSDEQRDELINYTASTYKKVNQALYNGDSSDPETQARIERIRAALDAAPVLEEPVTVYRGVGAKAAPALLAAAREALESGGSLELRGFQSTSLDPLIAVGFARGEGVAFEITARKGVSMEGLTWIGGEYEFLINDATRYKVLGVETKSIKSRATPREPSKTLTPVVIRLEQLL